MWNGIAKDWDGTGATSVLPEIQMWNTNLLQKNKPAFRIRPPCPKNEMWNTKHKGNPNESSTQVELLRVQQDGPSFSALKNSAPQHMQHSSDTLRTQNGAAGAVSFRKPVVVVFFLLLWIQIAFPTGFCVQSGSESHRLDLTQSCDEAGLPLTLPSGS